MGFFDILDGAAQKSVMPIDDLNDLSWQEIDRIGAAGEARMRFDIGAKKKDTMKDGFVAEWQIIGFDHDDLANGIGRAPISWDLVTLYKEQRCINSEGSNKGGFAKSELGIWLNEDFFQLCSDDLQSVIKTVLKKTSMGGGRKDILDEPMKVWLKSEWELMGRSIYSVPGEGKWYELYKQEGFPWFKTNPETGEKDWQWERSPYYDNAVYFCRVGTNGNASGDNSRSSNGLAPAFST